MELDSAQLFLSLFMSVVGTAYIVYGKKRPAMSFLIAGVVMSIFGYFVESFWITLLISVLLCAAPFFIDLD